MVRHKEFKRAIVLALTLDQPFRLLNIFEEAYKDLHEDGVGDVISKFSTVELSQLLKYIRAWNTNSKHSDSAQRVLQTILTRFSPSFLKTIPKIKEVNCFLLISLHSILFSILKFVVYLVNGGFIGLFG
jgi:U3 small nucleolar RNA-associated protein 13